MPSIHHKSFTDILQNSISLIQYCNSPSTLQLLTGKIIINYIDNILDKSFDAIFLPNECDSHFEHRFVSKFGKALIRNKSINLIQY